MKKHVSGVGPWPVLVFVWLAVFACSVGWIWNIIKIVQLSDIFTGMGVLRCIGVFLAPLGAVLGYL